tara:strand:- start:68051 stop:69175 length:1125 start_codon:yes stop_codon:yes gene_type:complete
MECKTDIDRDSWCLLGLPFDVVDLENSVGYVEEAITDNKSCFFSTPNLNFVIATQADNDFFQSVVDSDLIVADGMPLIWVAKLLGIPLTERVAGSTLFDELSKRPREKKIKVFFFGGQEGVAEKAYRALNKTSKGMTSCGFYDPGFVSIEQMSSAAIIDEINAAKPDFVVVALGAKKGQAWIQKNRGQLNAPVISHLGAVINFVAGSVERAPMVWQRFGLEWVWRIKQEPVLWKRYLLDGFAFAGLMVTKVFPLVIYDRVLKIKSGFNSPCVIEWLGDGKDVVRLVGSFKHQELQSVKVFLSSILNGKTVELGSNNLVLDFTDVEYIDGAFIATLMLFQRALEKQGKLLTITNVSARIKRILTMNNVRKRFVLK